MLRNSGTPLLLAPADVTGIPQTCSIWAFSTLIQQLAKIWGSELKGCQIEVCFPSKLHSAIAATALQAMSKGPQSAA